MKLSKYELSVNSSNGDLVFSDTVHADTTEVSFAEVVKSTVFQAYRQGETKPFYIIVVPSTDTLRILRV